MKIWKTVRGYEGFYEVSDDGLVKNVQSGQVLKFAYTYNGYEKVKLYKNTASKTHMVHRLVAGAFIENPDKKPQVNHKNGIKTDNTVNNLEWVTQTENLVHAYNNGLLDTAPAWHAQEKKVAQIDAQGNVIKVWPSMSEAARCLNLHVSNISRCCAGRIRSTGGYKWSLGT